MKCWILDVTLPCAAPSGRRDSVCRLSNSKSIKPDWLPIHRPATRGSCCGVRCSIPKHALLAPTHIETQNITWTKMKLMEISVPYNNLIVLISIYIDICVFIHTSNICVYSFLGMHYFCPLSNGIQSSYVNTHLFILSTSLFSHWSWISSWWTSWLKKTLNQKSDPCSPGGRKFQQPSECPSLACQCQWLPLGNVCLALVLSCHAPRNPKRHSISGCA